MKRFLPLLLCALSFSVFAQKKNPYKYEYIIGDDMEERHMYAINTLATVSVLPTAPETVTIAINFSNDSIQGHLRFINPAMEAPIENGKGSFTISLERLSQPECIVNVDIEDHWDGDYWLVGSDLAKSFFITLEKKDILNDPDSGGIKIHSKEELSKDELTELIKCYISNGQNCYNKKKVQISIIL